MRFDRKVSFIIHGAQDAAAFVEVRVAAHIDMGDYGATLAQFLRHVHLAWVHFQHVVKATNARGCQF